MQLTGLEWGVPGWVSAEPRRLLFRCGRDISDGLGEGLHQSGDASPSNIGKQHYLVNPLTPGLDRGFFSKLAESLHFIHPTFDHRMRTTFEPTRTSWRTSDSPV